LGLREDELGAGRRVVHRGDAEVEVDEVAPLLGGQHVAGRVVQVGVGVDQAGDDEFAAQVHLLGAGGHGAAGADAAQAVAIDDDGAVHAGGARGVGHRQHGGVRVGGEAGGAVAGQGERDAVFGRGGQRGRGGPRGAGDGAGAQRREVLGLADGPLHPRQGAAVGAPVQPGAVHLGEAALRHGLAGEVHLAAGGAEGGDPDLVVLAPRDVA
ncbi:MAG: hypothetical protein ACK559_15310, partial [bacterium]